LIKNSFTSGFRPAATVRLRGSSGAGQTTAALVTDGVGRSSLWVAWDEGALSLASVQPATASEQCDRDGERHGH
jgi:hypothetical protein